MRIVLFLIGAIAATYLIVKGFRQVLEESRQQRENEQGTTIEHDSDQDDDRR
ncbi:hypothetical protein L1889_02565 [Paenalcaligenes niemegkensis]|uniref:hypothetical protein n=1 Tax=Paenalcaligenes niemegkensis TaxID=2895469 RepID=UPI001EE8EF3A|nr:hypothetical protein [Paenalcaligenes niemegkensis]MCQ9615735.1 hypothetical protein [Paenalcaligenes niemegkensis]